jgi:hypothetical protein
MSDIITAAARASEREASDTMEGDLAELSPQALALAQSTKHEPVRTGGRARTAVED